MCGKNNADPEDEMEEAFRIIGRDEKCIHNCGGETWREKNTFKT